jgi:hypothetical protein
MHERATGCTNLRNSSSAPQRPLDGPARKGSERATRLPRYPLSGLTCMISVVRMGASASLERAEVSVDPGSEGTVQLRVRNNGNVVDQMTFEVVGNAAPWIDVEPPSVSLFPGAEETVIVRFAPPRQPEVVPGPTPFGVKVLSHEDPEGSVVEEGVVDVGLFSQRSLELYPVMQRGRRRGSYDIAIDNRGNAPIDVSFAGSDPESTARYNFAAEGLQIAPGAAAINKLRVVPVRTFWKGSPKTHQFQVIATEEGKEPELLQGTLLQESMLPPWVFKAVLAVLALALVLFILWQTLFKPQIKSAAKDAVAGPLTSLQNQVDELTTTTATLPGGAPAPTTTVAGGGGGGGATTTVAGGGTGGGPTTGTTTPAGGTFVTPFGNPADFVLGTPVANGTSQEFSQSFSGDFALTDLVVQNPHGDVGTVQIKRNDTVLFDFSLNDFRTQDLHNVAPLIFKVTDTFRMNVVCQTATDATSCPVAVSFAGFQK